jgi:hypothetical protein
MDVKTSMIEMHLLNHGRLGVRSPANLVYQHEHVVRGPANHMYC